jgi:tRNA threonylcarbamoyl adenosine modification protein (Sua5/YciO/YrdC/YwlC family)
VLLPIHPANPDSRRLSTVVECLKAGGVIICPTDTVYSFACDIENPKGLEMIAKLKGEKADKATFSIVCADLSHLSNFCMPISSPVFKMIKRALPGPYTFILNANGNVPKLFKSKKKTIGIRVPDNKIILAIVAELGRPLVVSSVHDADRVIEYTTDPELIHERHSNEIDIVIAGGFGGVEPSTVIDCTGQNPELVRQGKGSIDVLR